MSGWIVCWLFLVFVLFFILWFGSRRTTEVTQPVRESFGKPCGCVFDIDGTLTIGDASKVVQLCKDNGCAIGINTARGLPYAEDVPLAALGFPLNVLSYQDFVYNPAPTIFNIVSTKVAGLQEFQNKWTIPSPHHVLFFDDSVANLRGANEAGFAAVRCSTDWGGPCGIGPIQEKITRDYFRSLQQSRRLLH